MSIQCRIIILGLFSLLSVGAVANELYTCKLDAKKTKGWIPSTIQISFNDDRQVTKLYSANYDDYDIDKAKVIRYTKDFREIKYIGTYKTLKGANRRTIHTITILPKLNNKISYTMKFSHFSNHYTATGKCKKAELNQTKAKTKTKATLTCPADISMCSGATVCARASYFTGSQHLWDKAKSSQKYVTEAKRRGLSCDGATVFTGKSESVQKNTSDIDQTKDRTTLAYKKLNGYGVAKDLRGALRLFLMSAKQGDANAQNWLGKMYHQGNGAIKNYKKAYMWFNIAHANGYTTAGSTRDLVGQSMSSSDISAAQDTSSA